MYAVATRGTPSRGTDRIWQGIQKIIGQVVRDNRMCRIDQEKKFVMKYFIPNWEE